jgi:dienelactone hydrolase
MRRLAVLFTLTLAGLAWADGGKPAAPAAPADPQAAVKALLERCRYASAPYEVKVADPVPGPVPQSDRKIVVEAITYPSAVKSVDPERNDVVKARLLRTEKPEPAAVIVLGGWRMDPLTPGLAAKLVDATNLQALVIDLPFQGYRTPKGKMTGQLTLSSDLDQNEATFVQAVQDVARGVDWLVRERKVDPKRIGVMGTSLGGFIAGCLYGMDDRFSCGVMQLSGGDVASVIYAETNWLTQNIRDELAKAGHDEASVRQRMKPMDPITWARPERRAGLFLLAAQDDEIVPLETVHALAKAYGGAALCEMPGAKHISPNVVQAHFQKVIDHFRTCLLPKAAATAPAK